MPKVGMVKKDELQPFWQTTDGETVRLYHGDVLEVLKKLPYRSVHCVITSPPYYGLRDYQTAVWSGGQNGCTHKPTADWIHSQFNANSGLAGNATQSNAAAARWYKADGSCRRCNAKRTDNQLGVESNPNDYIEKMVEIFWQVRRILRGDGTLWLNIGDSYEDQLLGIPWRLALALQADGWILRQDIIWSKPGPTPESVRNRCTKAHEYIFLFAKEPGYYYDIDAIKDGKQFDSDEPGTRNKRSVWTVSSGTYGGTHFATFPNELIEPCLLAGTSEYGACSECGIPWRRVLDISEGTVNPKSAERRIKASGGALSGGTKKSTLGGTIRHIKTIGWEQVCRCNSDVVPCVILDPFIGSGTSCLTALSHGRRSWGIDLNADYLANHAKVRIEGALVSRPALAHLAGLPGPKVVGGGITL